MHIGAKRADIQRQGAGKVGPGLGKVMSRDEASCSFKINVEGTPMRLGLWWLEAASRGGPKDAPPHQPGASLRGHKGRCGPKGTERMDACRARRGRQKMVMSERGRALQGAPKPGGVSRRSKAASR